MNIDALSIEQQEMLIQATQKSSIVDFGGYDGDLALWLLRHGAKNVLVIDKEMPNRRARFRNSLLYMREYFENVPPEVLDGYDTAVLCRPSNNRASMAALVHLLPKFHRVIYIGLNDETTATGMPSLFVYLLNRKLELYIENHPYRLLMYGEPLAEARLPVAEELAGLHSDDSIADAKAVAKLDIT